ncbi:MAG: ComEC family competence protein [Synechococcaceae cyanobacterium RL_1_2]|nr:ComEC family competence protein [Synechococcaceae cyanobacterium RL_1_2]
MVAGKIYVTVPSDRAGTTSKINLGSEVEIMGRLYPPFKSNSPGGFNFEKYLHKQGAFAGFKATTLTILNPNYVSPFSWLRDRIVTVHKTGLGQEGGALLSSIVLGRRAVDLPGPIQDGFIQAGLAHVLAASGFHVGLLLGVILFLTQNLSPRSQLIIGAIALTIYIGLTGLQASILRAGLMGLGGLVALTQERKVDPLRGLLLAAVIILIYNPNFLGDIGFQLSFAATLGLMITLPSLQQRLDWLPTPISTSIAIPIAASLWTMPLLFHHFSGFSLYSIPLNVVAGPLILIISLGGMISALVGVVYPPLGSLMATVLTWPINGLMGAVTFSNNLPLSDFATGKSPLWLTLVIYAAMVAWWLWPNLKPYLPLILVTLGSIFLMAMVTDKLTLLQVTILPNGNNPLIVVEQQINTILLGSPDKESDRYILQPFLRYRGINHIDCQVKLNPDLRYNCLGHSLNPDQPPTPASNPLVTIFILGQSFSPKFRSHPRFNSATNGETSMVIVYQTPHGSIPTLCIQCPT